MSESTTDLKTPEEERRIVTAIIGGGGACAAILHMVQEDKLGRFRMSIQGVADTAPDASSLLYAREIGVELVTTDYRELYRIPDLGLLIELTGSDAVRDEIERTRPRHVKLIDHFGARLFWELHQAEEAIIEERTKMRERVEAERDWIAQIFDAIPDEVLVVDTDMAIQRANASFLRNNEVSIDEIRGRFCYDLPQTIRGDCQVAVDNCPYMEVIRSRQTKRRVCKHFDKEGNPRYAAIVGAPLMNLEGEVTGMIEMTRDITNRILLEEELKATEVQLRQFMERAPLATYVKNRQGQYIELNRATCTLFGRPKSEIIGRTDMDLFARETAAVLREGDQEILHGKEAVNIESKVLLDDKTVFLATTKYPVMDADNKVTAVVGLSRNMTARKKVEEELGRTQEYLQNILNNSNVIIITTDLQGQIVSFNRSAEVSLGYKADEIIGKPCSTLFREPEERALLERRVRRGDALHDHEEVLVCKDGSEIPVAMSLSQLKDNTGKSIGMVEVSRDISHRKALMNQIIQSDRLAAVGRLAAGVAHEINNPLAVIGQVAGYLEELCEEMPEDSRRIPGQEFLEGFQTITAQVKRCSSITHRLLGFARKSEARIETANINAALDEILPFLEKEARMASIRIHRQYEANIPQVSIEEVQFEEVLINLITNSIQAIGVRGGGNIWITVRQDNGKVILTIRDDGPGIAESVRDRLFDPFVSTKTQGQGTGLGLSICYGIVKRYDGEIRVESEPGEGATFQVVLRVCRKPSKLPE